MDKPRGFSHSVFKAGMLRRHYASPFCVKGTEAEWGGGHDCSTFEPAVVVVTEAERRLCRKDSQHGGTGVCSS